jgi:hypothetical protein
VGRGPGGKVAKVASEAWRGKWARLTVAQTLVVHPQVSSLMC